MLNITDLDWKKSTANTRCDQDIWMIGFFCQVEQCFFDLCIQVIWNGTIHRRGLGLFGEWSVKESLGILFIVRNVFLFSCALPVYHIDQGWFRIWPCDREWQKEKLAEPSLENNSDIGASTSTKASDVNLKTSRRKTRKQSIKLNTQQVRTGENTGID
jgi:hypothetical protein